MYKNILILPDGTELRSGAGTTNAIKSVKLTEMVNSAGELTIGSCCSHMLEATLITPGGALDITAGEAITLRREDPQGIREDMGVFTVEAPTRPTPNTLKLTGFDNVSRLDKDLTAWLAALTGWPYGVNEFADLVCRECNLTFISEPNLPNGDYKIEQWMAQGVTGRQMMRWLGEIVCRFVYADELGSIRFGWYRDSGKTLAPAGDRYYFAGGLSYENYTVAPIDTVQLRLASSPDGLPWPPAQAEENAYVLERNPILEAYVTETLIHYLDVIHAEVSDLPDYTPCRVSAPADPSVRAGSILHITTPQGRELTTLVMEKTSNGRRDTYTCTGSHRRDSSSALHNKSESEKSAEAAKGALSMLNQQAIFNRLTNNGEDQGIFLKDGKVYINAEYMLAGSFTSTAEVFLDPGFEEAETIRQHLLGSSVIPEENLLKYDFNSDGDVTITDALIAQKCALGMQTLKEWEGAVNTPVTVTVDASNTGKVIWIYGTNMWGRDVEYYLGFTGANIGKILGDLAVSGALSVGGPLRLEDKLFVGSGLLVDEIPEDLEEGRLVLKKVVI